MSLCQTDRPRMLSGLTDTIVNATTRLLVPPCLTALADSVHRPGQKLYRQSADSGVVVAWPHRAATRDAESSLTLRPRERRHCRSSQSSWRWPTTALTSR